MRIYTSCWLLVAAQASVLAGLSLVATAGWGTTLATVVAVGMLAGVMSYSWRESFGPASMSVVGWIVGSAAGALLFLGLPLIAGRAAFLVFFALGITCPPLVRLLVRRPASRVPRAAAPGPAQLEDPLLTLAWLETSRRLRAAATPAETLAVVQDRAQLLDDLEQRSPEALRAWLASTTA